MTDPPPHPDSSGDPDADPGAGPQRGSTTGTPRWVKVFGIIALVVVVLFVIVLITGGPGGHGPSRHTGGLGDRPVPSSVSEQGAHQP